MPGQIGRLKTRPQFLRVAAAGRKWSTPGLVLQAADHQDDLTSPSCLVGFTTSRKVGGAVERNRARRRLRALAAELLPLHAKTGLDYVVIGRPSTVTRPFAELRQDLLQALERVNKPREKAIR